jgi:hypothetical protein
MDAKTRYRQRQKLRVALPRVLEVLADNVGEGIPPDRPTALMAGQVLRKLVPFALTAGLDSAELIPDNSDLSHFENLKKARRKETQARYRRSRK